MNQDVHKTEIAALAQALDGAEKYRDALAIMNTPSDPEKKARAMFEYSQACTAARRAWLDLDAALRAESAEGKDGERE